MTRIVRFEEIDGDLVLRIPADIAARLRFMAGGEVVVTDDDQRLTVAPLDERKRRQFETALRVMEEHDEALAALAR
ncbi:hypothetical protein [Methylopila turkensis]|uniref:AbrB/MazE/SpoVT family DNA-binding domain-containing protein n=1 Tax=Methylopila turkensis TaxID=1437816 RepID=A0A9W6JPQ0_9HYPH|nr:hypothetical protein [Methylopila turkensis]GLK80256.1 hypothetical protein GCM10008174_19970 [Methylopila turkensis]